MQVEDILIIGGGPAGLTTAGALKQVGLDAAILERGERVGQSWEQRYARLHLHTVREFSGLAHYPIPRGMPKYLSKDQYAAYLRDYAAHFQLRVLHGTTVQRVRQDRGGTDAAKRGWLVDTSRGSWRARVVVIATGQFGEPVRPAFPGLEDFTGLRLHSSEYQSGQAYLGQRVLVVGAGNSGLEIAADLVEQGAGEVAVSIRSGPPVVPRDFLGVPAQVFGIVMSSFPPALSDLIGSRLSRMALGDLTRHKLPAPGWRPFASQRTPVIDVGFCAALKRGRLSIRPAVQAFTRTGVVFAGQPEENFDAVIFATGFRSGLERLLEPTGLLDAGGVPLSPSGAPTACPGLYFMGFFDTLRGFLYESNLASRRLAREILAQR